VILRLAWRLLRHRRSFALLIIACIAIGVSGRVAVGTASGAIATAIGGESRAVLGGDLEIAGSQALAEDQRAAVGSTWPADSATTVVRSFTTMASGDGTSGPVEVTVVEPNWPLVGQLGTNAVGGLAALHGKDPGVIVQADLLERFHLQVGGRLRLGQTEFTVLGITTSEPGLGASPFRIGPRVWLASRHLEATGLAALGARIRHALVVRLLEPSASEASARAARIALGQDPEDRPFEGAFGPPRDRFNVRTAADAADSAGRLVGRLTDWIGLVALLALALGAVGVAAVVRGHLDARRDELAVLRALGATPNQVAAAFILQGGLLGLIGSVGGALLGTGLGMLLTTAGGLPALPSPLAIAVGLAIGLTAALLASAVPALAAAHRPPLAVLRDQSGATRTPWIVYFAILFAVLAWFAIATLDARSWILGPAVAGLTVGGGLLLYGCSALILPLGRRLGGPLAVRLALRNLARPALRPAVVAAALGLAALLAGTALTYRTTVLAELARDDQRPALFLLDLHEDQLADLQALCIEAGAGEPELAPVIRARYRGRPTDGGKPASAEGGTREEQQARFFRSREQNLSFRDQLGRDETIIAGTWFTPGQTGVCSLEERFAKRLGVGLGDQVVFDISGVPLTVTITSLRRVRWVNLRPNFFILMPAADLVGAPTTWVATVNCAPAAARTVERLIAERLPNTTALDITAITKQVSVLVDRLTAAVQLLAGLVLAAGLAVATGVALAGARVRAGEAALLRALGAAPTLPARSTALEFALLGLVGGLIGSVLGAAGGALMAGLLLDRAPVVPWLELGGTAAAVAACSASAGLVATWRSVTATPLAVLRDEG